MSRYDLTDFEWRVIEPLLPNKPRGVPRVDDRRVLNGILWVLRTGAPWRDLIEQRDAVPIIPEREGAKTRHAFSKPLYRLRNRIGRAFNKLKQFRRIATRYEKLAANFLAMIKLATVRIWVRSYESAA